MEDENHVMKNLQKQNKSVRRHEIDIKFGVFKFKEIREGFESLRMRNNTFLLQPFERKKKISKFSL